MSQLFLPTPSSKTANRTTGGSSSGGGGGSSKTTPVKIKNFVYSSYSKDGRLMSQVQYDSVGERRQQIYFPSGVMAYEEVRYDKNILAVKQRTPTGQLVYSYSVYEGKEVYYNQNGVELNSYSI